MGSLAGERLGHQLAKARRQPGRGIVRLLGLVQQSFQRRRERSEELRPFERATTRASACASGYAFAYPLARIDAEYHGYPGTAAGE